MQLSKTKGFIVAKLPSRQKKIMFCNSPSIKFALFVDILEVFSDVLFYYCWVFSPTKCNNFVGYCGFLFLPMSEEMTKKETKHCLVNAHEQR